MAVQKSASWGIFLATILCGGMARALITQAGACHAAWPFRAKSGWGLGVGLGFLCPALGEAVAVGVHLEDADVMCEPVQQCAG